ncbi:MAG: hypothetical protein J5803_02575, partial [Desulfovibrio sp.]|nr:hypothetical protein [Desulfovibrio sp.]
MHKSSPFIINTGKTTEAAFPPRHPLRGFHAEYLMKIEYFDDPKRGPGYGFFLCRGESFVDGTWNITLQRSVDRQYLGQSGGWIETQQTIALPGSKRGEDLVLPLGPNLINALSTQDTYKLSVVNESTRFSGQFRIATILYSTEESLANAVVLQEEEKAPSAEKSAPEPSPVPTQAAPVQDQKSPKKNGLWIIGFLLLLLALGAGAYYYWFFVKTNGSTPEGGDTPIHAVQPPSNGPNEGEGVVKEEPKQEVPEKEEPKQNGGEEPVKQEENPKPEPSPEPAPAPSVEPVPEPEPTPAPSAEPVPEPEPTPAPSAEPVPEPEPTPAPSAEPVPEPEPAPLPSAEPAPQPKAEPAPLPEAPKVTLVQEVQSFFRGSERTGEKAKELATRLKPTNPEEEDALFRLYYYAEEHGDTSLLLPYAAFF